ncbi:MAG: cyclic nucleotide-binding domain-containing protein [Candidatus Delongbacteria bacterium]|nr:cyclic nucleotide-binding domain-containing protein [Candidatus Delongbacteria bacterium]MBN2834091.1 cyclic nucleotide-binding domain-containing protein [Candidatus Delongbacteria bacterium]
MSGEIKKRYYKYGDYIFRQGDTSDDIYFIRNGRVKLFVSDETGEVINEKIVYPEMVFGEMDFIMERKRNVSAIAIDEVEVDYLDPRSFSSLYELAMGRMLKPIIQNLASRLRFLESNYKVLPNPNDDLTAECEDYMFQLIPITSKAKFALNGHDNYYFSKIPFNIGRFSGRRSDHLFYNNDLYLQDTQPYNISLSHLSIIQMDDEIAIIDNGSSFGFYINGINIGASQSNSYFKKIKEGENIIILGKKNSELEFKLYMTRKK